MGIIVLTSKDFCEYLNEIICVKHLSLCLEHRFNISYYFTWGWITQKSVRESTRVRLPPSFPLLQFFSEEILDTSFQTNGSLGHLI